MTDQIHALLDQIQERSRTAGDHVARLCTKEDRWKMSVPVQDDDSDILLTQITDRDVPQLAKALRAVMEFHARHTAFDGNLDFCPICVKSEGALYPCSPVQAINDALGADDD